MPQFAVALVLCALLGASSAHAAAADLFAVKGVAVDATAESATAARDRALANGRPVAWQKLFRRLTPPTVWARQPQLDDNALQRIIRSVEVANERRSTTRYLAEISYNFNRGEVQRMLRQAGIPYTDIQARPALVIPLVDGKYDPAGQWAQAWGNPSIAQGLVPTVLPMGDAQDLPVLTRADLSQADWVTLAPLAKRYGVTQIVIASATGDGNSAVVTDVTPTGRQSASLAFAHSTFLATADAAALKLAEVWKNRAAVDYSQRSRLTAEVEFASPHDWPKIRSQLAAVKSITDLDVLGVSLRGARVELSFVGKPEQLKDAMVQQNLDFTNAGGQYSLQLAANASLAGP